MAPFDITDIPEPLARWRPPGTSLAFPEQGMTSSVAFCEPGEVVLKRCIDPRYTDWIRREREVLEALGATDLPVPRVLDYLDAGTEVWLVMTRLPGTQAAEVLFGSGHEARIELLRRIGTSIRQLHDTPVPAPLHVDESWIDRQLVAARGNLEWCDGNAELLEHLRATRPIPVPPRLIHGDLNLENVLVAGGRVSGIVDWAGGDIGDPRCDVALALLSDEELPIDQELLDGFFAGYGAETSAAERAWFEGLYEFF